jgi:hypothetical protein
MTGVFTKRLESCGMPPADFCHAFAAWKMAGGPLSDPYFGKDGPYERPLRGGKIVLWHVHLRPENSRAEMLQWDQNIREGKPKTSDAVLIYTHTLQYGYLLLHAIWEAGAHEFANMSTQAATTLMNHFADLAEEFAYWGKPPI